MAMLSELVPKVMKILKALELCKQFYKVHSTMRLQKHQELSTSITHYGLYSEF